MRSPPLDDGQSGRGVTEAGRCARRSSMTSSILPLSTCLAMLSVKPLAVAAGTWEGRASAESHDHVHHDGPAGAGERCPQGVAHVAGLLDADAARAERRGYLAEVRVHEISPERDETGLLLLEVDKIQHAVVEDDVHDAGLALDLGQQVTQPEHGEAAVAAQGDGLPPGKASAAPKAFGAALAMDAQVNEPNIRRSRP